MKVTFVLCLAVVGCCYAATNLQHLIQREVKYLLNTDHDLTVDHCTTKCDALFDLVNHKDEHTSDQMCAHACQCQINKQCGTTGNHTHTNTTHKPHHHHNHNHTTTMPSVPNQ